MAGQYEIFHQQKQENKIIQRNTHTRARVQSLETGKRLCSVQRQYTVRYILCLCLCARLNNRESSLYILTPLNRCQPIIEECFLIHMRNIRIYVVSRVRPFVRPSSRPFCVAKT